MNCANCSVQLGGDSAVAVDQVSRISGRMKQEREDEEADASVSLLKALQDVFEVPPLHLKGGADLTGAGSRFVRIFTSEDNEAGQDDDITKGPVVLCSNCAEPLSALYTSYLGFLDILSEEGQLWKKLQLLEEVRTGTPKIVKKTSGKKRGRPRKVVKVEPEGVKLEDDESYMEEVEPPLPEPVPDSESDVPGRRPVRKSSARNKNWAQIFKQYDKVDFMEQGEEELQKSRASLDDSVESDVKDEDDDEDAELSQEEEDCYVPTDEDEEEVSEEDDEYLPDSDLENVLFEGTRSRLSKDGAMKQTHDCDYCGLVFAHSSSLKYHMRKHQSLLEPVVCSTCNRAFSSEDFLRRHRRRVHGEYIPYKTKDEHGTTDVEAIIQQLKKYNCPVCEDVFEQSDLQSHVNAHNVVDPWKCTECTRGFSTFNEFNTHKLSFHQSSKFPCPVCNITFRSAGHLRQHQLLKHHVRSDLETEEVSFEEDKQGAASLKYKCSECGKEYSRAEKLKEHMIVHGIGEKFKCEICGREFSQESSKRRHVALHSSLSQYDCPEHGCEKSFTRKDHLARHLDTIHGISLSHEEVDAINNAEEKVKRTPKAKEIPCPYCSKMIRRERMRLHLTVHTGEKRHECKECGQKFSLRTTLRTHVKCVHQGLRRYACTICPKSFKRSNHLKDHMKLHEDADNRPFQCETCLRSFKREKNLKTHMITHVGTKDFMCEQCGKAFNRMDNLRAHVRSVHEGLQIRKKRTTTVIAKPAQDKISATVRASKKATPKTDSTDISKGATVEASNDATSDPSTPLKSASNSPVSSVLPVKKPYTARKRGQKEKVAAAAVTTQSETVVLSTILNVENSTGTPHLQMQPPGTIVALAVDPASGNVISTEGLVQIEQIQTDVNGTGEGVVSSEFDGQRTTILQLAPGQVFPTSSSGPYQTYYYYQQ